MLGLGHAATFGAVGFSESQIFLCQGAQRGRGTSTNTTAFQQQRDEGSDKCAWMSVWVDDPDEAHRQCLAAGLDVTFPPTDMPWTVRLMHLRHPEGHVSRIGKGIEEHQ